MTVSSLGCRLVRLSLTLALLLPLWACTPAAPQFIAQGKPEKLSDWHMFVRQDQRLKLNSRVLHYELNTPLFTDYAHKLRTLWMPSGKVANYRDKEVLDLPVGTVITKTFYYPKVQGQDSATVRQSDDSAPDFVDKVLQNELDLKQVRLLETRVLVHREQGWEALPYVWNEEQTEAFLERTGASKNLRLLAEGPQAKPQAFAYVVPNENQCASCHVTDLKSKLFQPIGLKARHLNRERDYAEGRENQLVHMVRSGFLQGLPQSELPRAAAWNDTSFTLDAQARAYLDINCAHCHNARGAASNTALNLDAFVADERSLGLCKASVAAGKGTGDRMFDIMPGRPDDSIMIFRMASQEGGVMMPELGRSTVHAEGLDLIKRWIAAMPRACEPPS